MKRPLLRTLALLLAIVTMMGAKAELLTPVSISPTPGVVTSVIIVQLKFDAVPSPNLACNQPAKLYFNDNLKYEIYPASSMVQFGIEGMADNDILICFTRTPEKTVGTYKVEIPEGFFTFNGGQDRSEAVECVYTIPTAVLASVSPAGGYFTEIPNLITLTYKGATSIEVIELEENEDGRGVILFDTPDDSLKPENIIVNGDKVMLVIPSDNYFTRKGNYSIELPSGAFKITMPNGEERINSYQLVRYYIPVIPYPHADPAPGPVTSLEKVTLYFTEEEDVTFDRLMLSPSLFTIVGGEKGERMVSFSLGVPLTEVRGSRSLTFNCNAGDFHTLGTYRLLISKSGFAAYGYLDQDNPDYPSVYWSGCDYYWDYTIVPSFATITPAYAEEEPAFGSVSELVFSLPYASEAEVNPDVKASVHDMFDRELPYEVELEVRSKTRAAGDLELVAKISPAVTEKGVYTLIIPAGALKVNGEESSKLSYLDFSVDPALEDTTYVGEISDNPLVDVYSIDGTLVLRGASADAIATLPCGLYIAGGKKYIVR